MKITSRIKNICFSQKFKYDRYLEQTNSNRRSCNMDSNSNCNKKTFKICSRFSKNGKKIALSRSHIAFGFGDGLCPGKNLAVMEMKIIMIALLTAFDINLNMFREKPELDHTNIGFGILPPKMKSPITISLLRNNNQKI